MRLVIGSLGIALAALLAQATLAGAHGGGGNCCCEKCGCDDCDISCRLVCDVKKVPHTTYCCKCEPFCAAHPCPFNQVHECEPPKCECDSCDHKCAAELWLEDLFHCDNNHACSADSFHKKKLIKYVNQEEVRVYKWVAEKTCPRCGCCAECACGGVQGVPVPAPAGVAPAPSDMPPAPVPSKSASSVPVYNMPAGYHVSDSDAAAQNPLYRNFYKQ